MSVHKHGTTGPGCAGTCCLKATDLGVSFGGEEVLRDVSFHLHCGEIVALIGPNGAGKSSLFRTILGQVPHTGTIEFQRAGGDKTRPLIGYVPQSPSFDRGDPVSVFDFFSAAIWCSCPPPGACGPEWVHVWPGCMGRACWTGGWGPSPAVSSSVCCWPWR